MSIYKIPQKFKAGEFKFNELDMDHKGESLDLDYDTEYQMIEYSVPMYENQAKIYTVPRSLMPNGLTAIYGDGGELDKVTLTEGERTRLIYIRFPNIKASEKYVLKFVKEQADKICAEIIGRKQKLARLFFGKFYDGEAVEIAVITATAQEMEEVIGEYGGRRDAADNSGNYPAENSIMLDDEPLCVMLMCTNCDFQSMLFYRAATAVEERVKNRVFQKVDKTEDFKFISEEWD